MPTSAVIASVLSDHEPVVVQLEAADAAAWQAVDPVLLELCRLRIAMLLGSESELASRTPAAVDAGLEESTLAELASWPTSPRYGPRERACLAFTEQFVIDVGSMSDDLAMAVGEQLGDQGLADFVSAVLVVEQRQRLRLGWSRLFDGVPA